MKVNILNKLTLFGFLIINLLTTLPNKKVIGLNLEEIDKIAELVTVRIDVEYKKDGDILSEAGSGFIIEKKNNREGYTYTVLTNCHVIAEFERETNTCTLFSSPLSYEIRTHEQANYKITNNRNIKILHGADLALISFTSNINYTVSQRGNSADLSRDDIIHFAGYPAYGERILDVHKNQEITGIDLTNESNNGYKIQFSGKMIQGISGGPIFNKNGDVVAIYGKGIGMENTDSILLGIPINLVVKLARENNIIINWTDNNNARKKFDICSQKGEQGNYQEAINCYSNIILLYPDYAPAYANRGVNYGYLEQYAQAINDYSQAIKLNNEYHIAYYHRGLTKAREYQDFESALSDFNQAIKFLNQARQSNINQGRKLNVNLAEVYAYRGNIYYQREQIELAIKDYSQAIELNSEHSQAYYNRGKAYIFNNNIEQACDDFKQAASLFTTQKDVRNYQNSLDELRELECNYRFPHSY